MARGYEPAKREPAARAMSSVLSALALSIVAASQVEAAPPVHKRLCKQRIEWTAVSDTRPVAYRKAIDGWSAAATGQHGQDFARWDIAGVARISCTLTPEGHRCRAAASPCRDLAERAPSPRQ